MTVTGVPASEARDDAQGDGTARAALAAGVAAFRRRDFAEAAARFEAATVAAPAMAAPWLSLARALASAGRLAEARAACDTACLRAPEDARGPLLAARLAARADDGRARIAHLRAAAALKPTAVALRLGLVAALGRRLQHRPALAVAEDLLTLAPADPAVRLAAARCRLALGQLAEAGTELEASGAGGGPGTAAERERLRADLAARLDRAAPAGTGVPEARPPEPPPAPSPSRGRTPAPPASTPPASTPPTPAPSTPAPPAPADFDGLVTADMLRRIDRLRRRPRLADHVMILHALVLRDLRAHHRGNALGVLVELVRPAVVVFVHYWLFFWLEKPMPGRIPIEVYVLAGFSVWFTFQATWAGASTGGRWPAGATAWPGVTDLHLRLAKAGWGLMLNLAFCLLALAPLAVIGIEDPAPSVPETCLVFAMAGGSGFGFGLVLEGFGRRLAFVKTVEKLATWALFVTSGLYFSLATTPAIVARWYWYNPLLHLIEHQRHAFDAGYPVAMLDLRYPAVVTVALLVTGLLVYRSVGCPDHD